MTIENFEEAGLASIGFITFINNVCDKITGRDYGIGVSAVLAIVICKPFDYKQRKRFIKNEKKFEFDIITDYFLIKHSELEEKKRLVKSEMINTTKSLFLKYKFKEFNTETFLNHFESVVLTTEWE